MHDNSQVTVLIFTALLATGAFTAGLLGALTGLGGGVVIVPLLVLAFGVDLRYAIGASLVSVIATSSGAAAAYVSEGFTNVRLAMFLEVATTVGALSGALLAPHVPARGLAFVFGCVLLYSAWLSRHHAVVADTNPESDRIASALRLDGTLPSGGRLVPYHVRNVPGGFSLMYVAGVLSGLLGIGSGAVKVLAMDRAMRLPFKVSTTTSNFMIGVTAAASASVYLRRGYIEPSIAMPVVLGVLAGSMLGARILTGARTERLRRIFVWVIVALAAEMLYNALTGRL
jgi:uncharacterized membrane protein YfcA